MAFKRLGVRSLLYRGYLPLIAGNQHPIMHSHVSWHPSMQRHGNSSAPSNIFADTWRLFLPALLGREMHALSQHALSQEAHAPNSFCDDDEAADTDDEDHECEDDEVVGAATALQDYMQKELMMSAPGAAAVVENAPSFVKHLVSLAKKENGGEADVETENEDEFSQKVHQYLKRVGTNLLEPVLESIGAKHRQSLLVKLTARYIQPIFSLIKIFERLGVPRSSLGIMMSNDLQVLSCTENEIEAALAALKGLMIAEDEVRRLIQRYPLVLKADAISNILLVYDELEEFASRDIIIRRAVCNNPQHVHMYKKGCAKEVVEYLKSFNFTVFRLDRILQKHARLALTDVEKKLKRNVQFLEDVGLSRDLIYKVINRCPNFLLYSVEDNLEAKFEYFKELGFEEPEFCQVISRFPNLFSASLENKIKPAVEELRTLGLSDEGLKQVVLYRPCLFGYKLGGDISAIVKQLNQSSYPEDSKVTAFIKLYSRGTEHKQKIEDCLVQHGLSVAEAKEVLEKKPGILGYNEHVLNVKLESLKKFDIPVQSVLTVPEYLSFGMRKRVQRRERVLSYLKSKGLLEGRVTLKQLVLHSNTHFYKELVKPHSEDTELCKIWYRERDIVFIGSSSMSSEAIY